MMVGTRPQVAIVQRTLRLYRLPFFNELRRQLDGAGIDLRLLYSVYQHPPKGHLERGDAATLPWAQPISSRTWPRGTTNLFWQPALRELRNADLVIIEQASRVLLNYLVFAQQAMGRRRVALWGHGRSFDRDTTGPVREVVKRWMSRRPDWWFAYTDWSADRVAQMGFPRERITVVRNATDTWGLARRVQGVGDDHLRTFRRQRGITGSNVGVFVGSLVRKRKLDFLIAAAEDVRAAVPDFELVVAGGGPLADEVQECSRSRPWLHYLGPLFDDDLARLLRASKVMLVPGWVGLVVVDSFASGVPLIASGSASHPPEVTYIEDGRNGRVVDDQGDPAAYAKAVIELLSDETARTALIEGCLASRDLYNVETMTERFVSGILGALEARP